ncbi:UPF0392 protein [Glycine soja]|uniref:Glycosyltransferase family 92 protein n=1 Tax=Glycine soja TaxID=3848 RepID=A0A0B2PWF2_GLYSO|nr:UPF0392 protein [Glycine soja]
MDSSPDQTRKRNQNQNHTLAQKSLFLCFSFFLFLFFFSSSHHSFYSHTSLQPSTLSTFPTPTPFPTTKLPVSSLHVLDRILFPDHVLLTLSNPHVFSPKHFHCVYYNLVNPSNSNPVFDVLVLPVLSTDRYDEFRSIARCPLPGKKFSAVDLRWRSGDDDRQPFRVSHVRHEAIFDSVAKIGGYRKQINRVNMNMNKNKLELCACTMVWNQARAMKEWVIYHAWLGVEKWFIYDNNSDDEIDDVVRELEVKGYNINRVVWPWIKSQEAGFSHCSLRAKEECKWVGFFDVDEFFYLREMKQNALISTVGNLSNSIAEIRTGCLNFGPSELRTHPRNGVSVGYTCRLRTPERHKSIVRPDLLHASLLNVVHHFELKEGFGSLNMPQSVAVINHYKYQVWEIFKAKFFRRVATYVVDWKEDANIGSKDRAPGLGTEAIEPSDWRLRFCEVWDTRLKDFLLSNFADQETGLLPWERSSK